MVIGFQNLISAILGRTTVCKPSLAARDVSTGVTFLPLCLAQPSVPLCFHFRTSDPLFAPDSISDTKYAGVSSTRHFSQISGHAVDVLQFSPVLTPAAGVSAGPQVEGSAHRVPPPTLSPVLLSDPLQIRVPRTLHSLLQWLTEIKKALTFVVYYEGYSSGAPRWRGCRGKEGGGRAATPSPGGRTFS